MSLDWYSIRNVEDLDSPSLVLYKERIVRNITQMIDIIGDVHRLRPHVKTYKMAEVIAMQMDQGIEKFKCATIAEAEMLARAGAPDVLLAYQSFGPKTNRLRALIHSFPETRFSTLVDNLDSANGLNQAFEGAAQPLELYLDLDVGMHRTGIAPNEQALKLFDSCQQLPNLRPVGLHIYDGHLKQRDLAERTITCNQAFQPAQNLADQIFSKYQLEMDVVAGGTPTFPIHARRDSVSCSPGTCLLWDWGYQKQLPDLEFDLAALVVSRIISKPGHNLICTDLGHKSIAAENPHPRVHFLNLPEAQAVSQSEEHLVLQLADTTELSVGDVLYGVPYHICPTCALYEEAYIIENKEVISSWQVISRNRRIMI